MSKSMLLNSSILPSRSEFWFWQVRNTAIEVTKDLYESYPRLGHLIDDFCKNMVRNLLSANPSVSMFPALPKTRFGELSFSANKILSCVSMDTVLGAGKNDLLLSQVMATIQSSQIMTYVMQAYCQLLRNDSLQKICMNFKQFQTIFCRICKAISFYSIFTFYRVSWHAMEWIFHQTIAVFVSQYSTRPAFLYGTVSCITQTFIVNKA